MGTEFSPAVSGDEPPAETPQGKPAEAPQPDPAAELERLRAENATLSTRVHETDQRAGRLGQQLGDTKRQLGTLQQQASSTQAAAGNFDRYAELLLTGEDPGAAFREFASDIRPLIRQEAEAIVQNVVTGLETRMEFFDVHPELKGNRIAVAEAVRELDRDGELEALSNPQAYAKIAERAAAKLSPTVEPRKAPQAPPVSAGTQTPQSPARTIEELYNPEREAQDYLVQRRKRMAALQAGPRAKPD
ncbi:MAG TPA: hypothetical protein VM537_07080 [Anaerolineae bacterium]|nr:hypothetical protein [Anaerolineae bacterium]